MLKPRLFRLYWTLERVIAPGNESSQAEYARVVTPTTRWLDLGAGHQLWPEWLEGQEEVARRARLLVGLDPDLRSLAENRLVHHRVGGLTLPFRDGAFDLITANMVFEHLDDPVGVLREIRRVLAPGGQCIFHTPNARYWQTALGRHLPQPIKNRLVSFSEDRADEDVYPAHYRINTASDVRTCAERAGFAETRLLLLNTSSAGRILLLGPLVVLELLWIRLTRLSALAGLRSNIIGVISPPGRSSGSAPPAAAG